MRRGMLAVLAAAGVGMSLGARAADSGAVKEEFEEFNGTR